MKLLILLAACVAFASANPTPASYLPFMPKFAFGVCLKDQNENVIVSPASVYTALGLAYLAAEGETASEMQHVLNFEGKTKEQVGQFYAEFMKNFEVVGFAKDTTEFKLANRIFVDQKYELAPKYNELATKYLQSTAEKVNFDEPQQTADKINNWVADNTKNRIKNIISAGDLVKPAVLVNAIYFKAQWDHRFEIEKTQKKDFHLTQTQKVPVDMMYQENYFNYAEWDELDAKAIHIPFVNTDIYMAIVLPNKVDGLKDLQEKAKTANIKSLYEKFADTKVKLSLPKFEFDYSLSLNEILKTMGLEHMFDNSNFSGLLADGQSVKFSDVLHKAFIKVDEVGTEAAAATVVAQFMSALVRLKEPKVVEFTVDHPFMFAIRDKDTIYFAGHVTKF